jgi:hypothetical protein
MLSIDRGRSKRGGTRELVMRVAVMMLKNNGLNVRSSAYDEHYNDYSVTYYVLVPNANTTTL